MDGWRAGQVGLEWSREAQRIPVALTRPLAEQVLQTRQVSARRLCPADFPVRDRGDVHADQLSHVSLP
jgi:hypothetical protein